MGGGQAEWRVILGRGDVVVMERPQGKNNPHRGVKIQNFVWERHRSLCGPETLAYLRGQFFNSLQAFSLSMFTAMEQKLGRVEYPLTTRYLVAMSCTFVSTNHDCTPGRARRWGKTSP